MRDQLTEKLCRELRADLAAIEAGTYVEPRPHPSLADRRTPRGKGIKAPRKRMLERANMCEASQ